MSAVCNCPMKGETDSSVERCSAPGPDGVRCTRPDGHDGQHTACNVLEHPATVWSEGV